MKIIFKSNTLLPWIPSSRFCRWAQGSTRCIFAYTQKGSSPRSWPLRWTSPMSCSKKPLWSVAVRHWGQCWTSSHRLEKVCIVRRVLNEATKFTTQLFLRLRVSSGAVFLSTDQYHLLGADIREKDKLEAALRQVDFDWSAPTMILSEVVLTYMETQQ